MRRCWSVFGWSWGAGIYLLAPRRGNRWWGLRRQGGAAAVAGVDSPEWGVVPPFPPGGVDGMGRDVGREDGEWQRAQERKSDLATRHERRSRAAVGEAAAARCHPAGGAAVAGSASPLSR